MKTHLLLLFSVLLLLKCLDGREMVSKIFVAPDMVGDCVGSVTLYEGFEETVVTKNQNVDIIMDKVKMEGCGCFRLHSRPQWRGRSYFLGRTGEHTVEEIGWSRVRSVGRVEC